AILPAALLGMGRARRLRRWGDRTIAELFKTVLEFGDPPPHKSLTSASEIDFNPVLGSDGEPITDYTNVEFADRYCPTRPGYLGLALIPSSQPVHVRKRSNALLCSSTTRNLKSMHAAPTQMGRLQSRCG